MVIRNREERSTAVWRFIGIASIPLLLLFVAGFSLGDTSGKEKTANRKMLLIQAAKVDSLESKMQQYDMFFTRAGILLKEIEKKTGELDADLATAVQANNVQLLQVWKDKERDIFDDFEDSLRVTKRMFKELENETPISNGADLIKKYITSVRYRIENQHLELSKQLNAGNFDEVKDALAQMDQKQKDMEKLGVDQAKASELANLQADLKDCRKELVALQKGASGAGSKNEKIVAGIKAKISAIQLEMLPNISDKTFKNDTDKLTKLKTQINNSLMGISTDLIEIK